MSDWLSLKNALNLKFRPIESWPGKQRYSRERSPFSAPMKDTLKVLSLELRELHAKDIVLQIAIREQDLRLDGLPRANAIAAHPGIILTFVSKHGPLRIAFDRFTKWEHNLRAVAMHLQHLRHATLYGVGSDGEVYRGWKALPPGEEAPEQSAGKISITQAAQILARYSSFEAVQIQVDWTVCLAAYREAARRCHPDFPGGSTELMSQVNQAQDVLKKWMGK